MLELGESGRYEFKSDPKAVTPKLLAALANWAALDSSTGVAHLLVGVDEETDEATGLVRGVPCGLLKGLDRVVSQVQDQATNTRPIPVDVFVVEEAVETDTPFVRVEIRPMMPPHYDSEGRRQTRQGRSTRALTDDEMLRIYLDREAGSFAQRFRQTAQELHHAVGGVSSQMDDIAEAIDENIARPVADLTATAEEATNAAKYASSAATSAESMVSNVDLEVMTLQRAVSDVRDLVEGLKAGSAASLASRVTNYRRVIWWNFTVDSCDWTSDAANRLTRSVHELLSTDISIDDVHNSWEIDIWSDLLIRRRQQRRNRGTMKWWTAEVREVTAYFAEPAYRAPDLPDLKSEIREDIDAALDNPESVTNRFRETLGPI